MKSLLNVYLCVNILVTMSKYCNFPPKNNSNHKQSKLIFFFTFQPTWLNLVPPLVSFLSTHPMVKSEYLQCVKAVTGGAAPFGPALIENFKAKCAPNDVKFREGNFEIIYIIS